ncbi:amino acid synthesis family protein [Euzebya tangerina]|uniref:amino acid synthesis family protein n=1 Tax=Euzebya tangerina TaxID=591198 RepID=UPI000E30F762|nr:amino acid synthesis family protein [Euzebya tangerina]
MTAIRTRIARIEEVERVWDQPLAQPCRRVVTAAVIANPYAGQFVEDLSPLYQVGEDLGRELGEWAVSLLGGDISVHSYGKGAIVGTAGELEHAAAVLHPQLGKGLRPAVGGGKSLIPSSKKMGGVGTVLDVPLGHKDAAYVRSHFDAIAAWCPDGPRPDELLVAVAVTDSGRPLARVGGLPAEDIVGEDGLR